VESSEFISNKNESNTLSVLIGSGGTCELWRTMIHNKFHVIKQLRQEYKGTPQHIESLRREFEIGFQLDHTNIIRYLEYNSNSEDPSILLEFIDGVNLSNAINKHTIALSVEVKKRILTQLCSAVEYLHSKQIYHLDLKPSNLMITFRGKNLKLIDFGHSVSDGDLSIMGGTKEFMPPEQLSNKYGVGNDVYAVGKIIEFLFSNEPQNLINNWTPIIKKCLQEDVNDRYETISELLEVIEQKDKKNYTKRILFSAVMLVAIILIIYSIVPESSNEQIIKATDTNKAIIPTLLSSKDLNNNSDQVETQHESITNKSRQTFTRTDSIHCASLGASLYTSFLIKYNESDKSIKSGSRIQTKVTDSIQNAWFEYSSKFEPESKEYRKAYDNYFLNFTTSQSKIMGFLYGSK